MELEERLSYLENVRDWQSLVEELEKGIASPARTPAKAQLPPEARARPRDEVSRRREGAQALPGRVQAQPGAHREPRGGAQRLLGSRQAQHGPEAPRAGAEGRRRRAARRARCSSSSATCCATRATGRRPRRPTRARSACRAAARTPRRSACLDDVQARAGDVAGPHRALLRAPNEASDAAAKARASPARRARRAALRARRRRGLLARAYAADPRRTSRSLPSTRGCSPSRARFDALEQRSTQILAADDRREPRGRRSRSPFGTRWVLRHQNIDIGATLPRGGARSSIPRTRARSSSCARPTARRAATGIAC